LPPAHAHMRGRSAGRRRERGAVNPAGRAEICARVTVADGGEPGGGGGVQAGAAVGEKERRCESSYM